MTPTTDPSTLARYFVNSVLDGKPPNGIVPSQCGPFAELVAEMLRAHQAGGTEAAKRTYAEYAKYDPAVATLRAADHDLTPVFRPYTFAEWMQRPAKQWLIDHILGVGDMVLIFGPSGSGKTFVTLDMLFASCTGGLFANRFALARPLVCAYAMSEGQEGMKNRLMAAAQHHGVEPDNLYLFDLAPQLFDAKTIESIARFTKEWREAQDWGQRPQLDLLVIDTLHGATVGADENSAQDMGLVLEALRQTSRSLGCAVTIAHHTNRAGTGERGSGSLRGAMGCMIEIKEASGKYVMECSKLKDGEKWKPQTFDLVAVGDTESVRVWWDAPSGEREPDESKTDADARTVIDLLRNSAPRRFTYSIIGELIGMGGSTQVYKILRRATQLDAGVKSGLQDPTKDGSRYNPAVYWYQSDEG